MLTKRSIAHREEPAHTCRRNLGIGTDETSPPCQLLDDAAPPRLAGKSVNVSPSMIPDTLGHDVPADVAMAKARGLPRALEPALEPSPCSSRLPRVSRIMPPPPGRRNTCLPPDRRRVALAYGRPPRLIRLLRPFPATGMVTCE